MSAPKVLRLSPLPSLFVVVFNIYTLFAYAKFVTFGLPLPRYDVANPIEVPPPEIMRFMRRYGYLEPNTNDSEALYHESAIIEAIKNVQKYGALLQTGKLDNATLHLFSKPRCGVPDIEGTPYYLVTSGGTEGTAGRAGRDSKSDKNRAMRQKRFVFGAPTWKKRHIGYFIANWSLKISQEQIERDLRRALDLWSQFSGLHFIRMNDTSADIIVGFGSKYHGDNFPFDGPSNILAHAYYPYELGSWGGDVHFDEDENWQENSTDLAEGVDFYSVAVHELGHSVGLAHSPVQSSIMFPYYKGPEYATLDADDKMAMSEMYLHKKLEGDEEVLDTTAPLTEKVEFQQTDGIYLENRTFMDTTPYASTSASTIEPYTNVEENHDSTQTFVGAFETVTEYRQRYNYTTVQTPQTPIPHITQKQLTTPTPVLNPEPLIPNICRGKFDAVTVFNGSVHIFKRNFVWRVSAHYTIEHGYPRRLHEVLPFLPDTIKQIDAAYTRFDGTVVIFTDQTYWLFDGNNPGVTNGPIALNTLLRSDLAVTKIDAAMVWPKNNLTYIFTGDHFWRYNDRLNMLEDGYTRSMRRWPGIPNNIDAATTLSNGKTYFFKDNIYWLYNNYDVRPERGYPRRASTIWLGCRSPTRPALRNFNTTVSFISSSASASPSSSALILP